MARQFERCLIGMAAGLLATVPMTAWMLVAKRRLSRRSQEPLPPTQITRQALQAVDCQHLSSDQQALLTTVNHFAYGAGCGGLYGQLFSRRSASEAVATGVTYGLGVWVGSYFGWLPAVGLYRSPAKDTAERSGLMIVAHVIWGGSLGLLTHVLSQREHLTQRRISREWQSHSLPFPTSGLETPSLEVSPPLGDDDATLPTVASGHKYKDLLLARES